MHRPLKSLGGVTPSDAASQETLRKKVRGLVQFIQECGNLAKYPIDIDRLSRKLGLADAAAAAAAKPGAPRDYSAMSTDPSDDCRFWFVSEYYTAAGQALSTVGWQTRVGSFQLPGCYTKY